MLEDYKDYIRTIRNLEEIVLSSRLDTEYEYSVYSEKFGIIKRMRAEYKKPVFCGDVIIPIVYNHKDTILTVFFMMWRI